MDEDIENAGLPAWREGGKVLAGYNAVIRRCAAKMKMCTPWICTRPFLEVVSIARSLGLLTASAGTYANHEDPREQGCDALQRLFLLEMSELANTLK